MSNHNHCTTQDEDMGPKSCNAKSHFFILIENLEKDLTPSSIANFIYEKTTVLPEAFVYPRQLSAHIARGSIMVDSEQKAQTVYDFLKNPNHFVVSSRGRPWVITDKVPARTFGASIWNLIPVSREEIKPRRTCLELEVIFSGTESYTRAQQLSNLFVEFLYHESQIFKRLVFEEKRILDSSEFQSRETGSVCLEEIPQDKDFDHDALDEESAKHENQNGLPADADCSKSGSKETGTCYTEEIQQDKDFDHDALDEESAEHENQNDLPADAHCSESIETGTFTEEIRQDKDFDHDAMDEESTEHENQNGLPAGADCSKSESKETGTSYTEEILQDKDLDHDKGIEAKEVGGSKSTIGVGADEINTESAKDAFSGDDSEPELNDLDKGQEIVIYSDGDAISGDNSDRDTFKSYKPEFNDFDKDRDASCFAVNQCWSCYDSVDGMPRIYAKVKKVCRSPFEVCVAWLDAEPADDIQKKWIDEGLPVGCGKFKVGDTQKISNCLGFSQQVHCEKGKRGSLIMHPRQGEVWALFKDWDWSWSSEPESRRVYKYEVVEVLSDFVAVGGVRVCPLHKIESFVSLFQRSSQSTIESFMVRPNELFRFSHSIRYFKMRGSEGEGVPVGSFELDSAALPWNPDNLYCPPVADLQLLLL